MKTSKEFKCQNLKSTIIWDKPRKPSDLDGEEVEERGEKIKSYFDDKREGNYKTFWQSLDLKLHW